MPVARHSREEDITRETLGWAGQQAWYGPLGSGAARPLRDTRDLDPLLERIDDARFVLLGEASHGTAEYYTWRAELSRRLISEKGFHFIAVEGDWPTCDRRDRDIKGRGDAGADAREARQGAIGVVYHPEYEQLGNYVPTVLPRRYDALLSIDETHAPHPLLGRPEPHEEIPETFPSGR
jgi:erythromycin esterase-like protein